MSIPISPLSSIPAAAPDLLAPARAGGSGFGAVLASAIGGVENIQRQSGQAVERLLSGEGQELHATVLATQRAELAFSLLVQVRNKVVQAYQEIMRMQV
jgi:flagellar hook-basal body complex protein FliE